MAGTVFGRLSLEEGDSANSLEGLEIKLGGEGKSTSPYLLDVWGLQDGSRAVCLSQVSGDIVDRNCGEAKI